MNKFNINKAGMQPLESEKCPRSEKSLSTLTKKFVEMLQAENVLDLNTATHALEVSKKRRVYDITNVLEGINLIKKSGKNLYKWTGRTNDDLNSHQEVILRELKAEQSRLQKEEEQLDEDLKVIKMNVAALTTSKSFCYLTKNDFLTAFGTDETILITKDYKQVKFNFESNSPESNSLLLNSHRQAELKDVHIIGDVLRPTQLKLVNSEAEQNNDSSLLFCFDTIPSDDDEPEKARTTPAVQRIISRRNKKVPWWSLRLNLFRRKFKPRRFLELAEEEREQLASRVLDVDKFKDKSMFHFISSKQLVSPSDYIEPDFINLNPPPDSEYEQNYSSIAPNIHDLFDLDVDPLSEAEFDDPDIIDNDYEMVEYLEDEDSQ